MDVLLFIGGVFVLSIGGTAACFALVRFASGRARHTAIDCSPDDSRPSIDVQG